ncbi:calcium-binding hemolysin isoform B [Chlorella sorokiniana]|uniref:Calcium-binding hemolysin isoform B n=1 Tax=Chlorella sorokiniana TaxID=3076 RepID=A0A2P6TP54_CHLSO|nr:calcium-binding hemolysin isoform B [Chlorella sorokiniana]|eukprot:PRW51112.1 calcium-binding hemolysin isoform B [Chlorella sorokiniana]
MLCSTQLSGSRVLGGGRLPAASFAAARPCLISTRPCKRSAASRIRSQRDRDHDGGRTWDDPHQTPPPHGAATEQPPAGGASFQAHRPHDSVHTSDFSSLATSDVEFGNDAITGSTLETPEQEAHWREKQHEKVERLHQADLAREAFEEAGEALFMSAEDAREAREEAHRELIKDESTAEEREDRYAGILDAIEELAAAEQADERMSPDAARLTVSGSGEEPETEFDVIRHTVDELGEGEAAAELIMRSYQGRNLEAEALETVDPSDTTGMPHPGDKYLRPHAAPVRPPPLPPGAARLHQLHSGPDFERHRALPLPRARGRASGGQGQHAQHAQQQGEGRGTARDSLAPTALPSTAAAAAGQGSGGAEGGWVLPVPPAGAGEDVDSLLRGARAQQHDPVGFSSDEQQGGPASSRGYDASSEGDDQIGLGPAAGEAPGSGAPAEAADDQIGFDQEALRGADALYYPEGDRHAPAAEPVPVNNEGLPPPPPASTAATQPEQGEVFDVERDALQGSDAMFYYKSYKSAGGGGSSGRGDRRRASAEEALRSGAVWGALRSTDEQHASFRRAMESPTTGRKRPTSSRSSGGKRGAGAAGPSPAPDRRGQPPPPAAAGAAAPAERDSSGPGEGTGGVLESRDELHSSFHRAMAEAAAAEGAKRSAAATQATRRYAADASGKRRAGSASPAPAQPAQASAKPSPAAAGAAAAAAGSSEGVLASLRKRQEEASKAQRSLAGLAARAKGGREPPPPPPHGLGRVLEVSVGRAAVAGLGSAAVSELLTQQSVMSQLLGRFEGPRQIELAIPLAQSAALGVIVAVVLLTAVERWASCTGTLPSWRPLGLPPAAQVWLGRGAMALFALLLAYETMHSNRPAFGTLFYLWF